MSRFIFDLESVLQQLIVEHRKLLKALMSRDPERAASAMEAHVKSWNKWLPVLFPLQPASSATRALATAPA